MTAIEEPIVNFFPRPLGTLCLLGLDRVAHPGFCARRYTFLSGRAEAVGGFLFSKNRVRAVGENLGEAGESQDFNDAGVSRVVPVVYLGKKSRITRLLQEQKSARRA